MKFYRKSREASPNPTSKDGVRRVLHVLNLDTIGGVERMFQNFAKTTDDDRLENHLLVTSNQIHPTMSEQLEAMLASIRFRKTWKGLKIPRFPAFLRTNYVRHLVSQVKPDICVFWNRIGDMPLLGILRDRGVRTIYYEHGACWLVDRNKMNREFIGKVDEIVANSHAAARVLAIRFGRVERVQVILNYLLPVFLEGPPPVRRAPESRSIRLGFAARLVALKAPDTAIRSLGLLREKLGIDATLDIAGEGFLMNPLNSLVLELNLGQKVRFLGGLEDMRKFYREIDILLVPSIREPFGLVVLEAASQGCPCVATLVDGIPEVVENGVTGVWVAPTQALPSHFLQNGRSRDIPEHVYDPVADALVEPRTLDPLSVANAVAELCSNPSQYEAVSRAAINRARNLFSFEVHYRQLKALLLKGS